jgi:hypothetical protein
MAAQHAAAVALPKAAEEDYLDIRTFRLVSDVRTILRSRVLLLPTLFAARSIDG